MGLKEEFAKARDFVRDVNFGVNYDASTFETTIRYSLHSLSSSTSPLSSYLSSIS